MKRWSIELKWNLSKRHRVICLRLTYLSDELSSSDLLYLWMRRYEREEYRCSLCSYACTIEKAFQRHLRAHAKGTAPETRVSCAVCGADRSSEVDLSRHMRRHRDDRYFCCDICIFRTVQLKKVIFSLGTKGNFVIGNVDAYRILKRRHNDERNRWTWIVWNSGWVKSSYNPWTTVNSTIRVLVFWIS